MSVSLSPNVSRVASKYVAFSSVLEAGHSRFLSPLLWFAGCSTKLSKLVERLVHLDSGAACCCPHFTTRIFLCK